MAFVGRARALSRLLAAVEQASSGRARLVLVGSGGVRRVADAVGVSPDTIRRGRSELDELTPLPVGRSSGTGGGRKRAEEHDPELPRRWTSWSTPTPAGIR